MNLFLDRLHGDPIGFSVLGIFVIENTILTVRKTKRLLNHSLHGVPKMPKKFRSCLIKPAFHDADTDSDSPDTPIHPYVRHARFPEAIPEAS